MSVVTLPLMGILCINVTQQTTAVAAAAEASSIREIWNKTIKSERGETMSTLLPELYERKQG